MSSDHYFLRPYRPLMRLGSNHGLHGFNETRNPFSTESADWLRGHAEGEAERGTAAVAASAKRRRRPANGREASA